jgi:hypothetical protein
VTRRRAEPFAAPKEPVHAGFIFGALVAFVAGVQAIRWLRPGLLLDADPTWLPVRAGLALAVLALAGAAGWLGARAFRIFGRSRLSRGPLEPLPLSRGALVALAVLALAAGAAARSALFARLPIPFLEDEVNLVPVALGLHGTPADFRDAIRPIPYGRPDPHQMIGVLYLEYLRGSLRLFGATVAGLRFPSLAAGLISLGTAALLGRALLPAGGGTLTLLVLAGLRWHVILSLTGWHSVQLIPLADLAALFVVRARRSERPVFAGAGGVLIGVGAHFYLAAWIAAAALAAFALWPGPADERGAVRGRRIGAFAAGFVLAVAPLFLLHEGRARGYFERAERHSVLLEMAYQKSAMPLLGVAADALEAPWFLPDPEGRHDLEDRTRLGLLAIPVAVALARALAAPRGDLSGYLLAHAGAALAGAVAGGAAGHPNGFRFGYLTSATAIAAAAGVLALFALATPRWRRLAALGIVGAVAVVGLRGLEQGLLEWPARQATFDGFNGEDTLIGQAAARWSRFGTVEVAPGLGRSNTTIETVRRYALDFDPAPAAAAFSSGNRVVRIAAPGARPAPSERVVECVDDAWGRRWAVVMARRTAI